jgi:hypothetical protein
MERYPLNRSMRDALASVVVAGEAIGKGNDVVGDHRGGEEGSGEHGESENFLEHETFLLKG